MRDINEIFSELAEYKRIQEQTAAIIDSLTDEVKNIMTDTNNFEIIGNEHKASWKQVTQNKVDTGTLKKLYPDIAAAVTKETSYKRFNFS